MRRLVEVVAGLSIIAVACVARADDPPGDGAGESETAPLFQAATEALASDRPGEANALVNLGIGEVLLAQQREQAEPGFKG